MTNPFVQHVYACLAYEATLRKIGALASSDPVHLKSSVEHVDLQFNNAGMTAVHVYSIETDCLGAVTLLGITEHHFSIIVRIDGHHYAADVFIGESREIRWNGEIAELHDGVPRQSIRMNTASAPW